MSQSLAFDATPHGEAARLAWLARMIEATTPDEVGGMILELARTLPGCCGATLLWPDEDGHLQAMTGVPPAADDVVLAAAAVQAADGLQYSVDGRRVAVRLLRREHAVLLLSMTVDAPPPSRLSPLEPCLQLAAHHLRHILKLSDLHDSHRQLERSENLQRALFAISDLAGSELDMPELLRGIHAIVSTLMYAENFFIVRHDPERRTMRFLYYADVEDREGPDTTREKPLEDQHGTVTWHLLTSGKPLMGSGEQLSEQVCGPLIWFGPDSVDWLGVPMVRDGQVHGALVVQSYKDGISFSAEDRALLEFVGSHILTALERKGNKDELEHRVRTRTLELAEANRGLQQEVMERQRAEQLQVALFHLAVLATADIDKHEFYQRVHAVVGRLLNAENFFIALVDKVAGSMKFAFVVDVTGERYLDRPLVRGLSEHVLAHGPLLVDRAAVLEMIRCGLVEVEALGAHAECWLGVPLLVGDEVIGLVAVQSYAKDVAYGVADQELLTFAALQIANSIYRRRSAASLHRANAQLEQRVEERTRELRQQIAQREEIQQQLKHQVMHDPLTGLPNRGYLRDRLDRVLALIERQPKRRCALLYLDVDRFKVINDSLGHLAGDEFLKAIATRLQQCVREPDVVARLSGDEFAILLEDVEVPAAATNVARRMLKTLGMPLQIAGKELEPSVSVGIACGDSSYHSADELLRDADIALYRAKELGRKRFAVFDETLAKNMVDVLTLESELRHALQEGQFEPYFQPVTRLGDGQVVGYEALIRWNHPQRGVLRPGEFVKIAQDGGHIETIDWRLFELACGRISQLPDDNLFLTLNVSALHLRHASFDRNLLELLQRTGLSPTRLVVEVTEGALLDDPERVRATLERLRVVGVGAALDDFGTGYSSLSYLNSLPLRILKIDRAFVDELDKSGNANSTTVVAAILALARALDIQVIAEGIETEAQREALVAMGCELGQGYLLGRPAPIEHWLAAQVDDTPDCADLPAMLTR